jgi:hypothetical protein
VRYLSRQNYGRPISQVEQAMEERRRIEKTPNNRPRPRISGGDSWGSDEFQADGISVEQEADLGAIQTAAECFVRLSGWSTSNYLAESC